ncbi:MAG: hypothetical protein R3266_06585, partial [Gemmatimonadota bacterium]|nr:hypothetical protein [Gemmatimonadota bacterium]
MPGPEVPPPASDPEAALEEARDAQRAFERTRRRHYPRAAWTTDACHEHIGRFCLHHDDDDGWAPEPDPREVVVARDRLIAILDSADRVLPGDRWLLGQRVRYRLEAERPGEAVTLASDCAASTSWCEALRGFVLHGTGDHLGAELAFDRSLDAMTPEARCAWEDIGPLLSGRDASRY